MSYNFFSNQVKNLSSTQLRKIINQLKSTIKISSAFIWVNIIIGIHENRNYKPQLFFRSLNIFVENNCKNAQNYMKIEIYYIYNL